MEKKEVELLAKRNWLEKEGGEGQEVLVAAGFHCHVKCKEMEEAMEPLGGNRIRSNIFCVNDFFAFKYSTLGSYIFIAYCTH